MQIPQKELESPLEQIGTILVHLRDNQGSIKTVRFRKMNFSHFLLRILRIRRIARTHRQRKLSFQMLDHNGRIKHKVDPDHLHLGLDSHNQTIGEITHLHPDREKQTRKIDFPRSSRKLSQA